LLLPSYDGAGSFGTSGGKVSREVAPRLFKIMNLDKIKSFFSNLSTHDLLAGGAGLVGIILIVLMFKAGKFVARLLLFLIAIGLFVGAWWWHQHQ
jgi:hypothetical protein